MTCPICQKDTDHKYRPFCGKRCADIDLGRWLNGSYSIPGDPADETELPSARAGDDPPPPRRH